MRDTYAKDIKGNAIHEGDTVQLYGYTQWEKGRPIGDVKPVIIGVVEFDSEASFYVRAIRCLNELFHMHIYSVTWKVDGVTAIEVIESL